MQLNNPTDYRSNMPDAVAQIGEMHFEGNTLPENWFNVITDISGKPDIDAILLLSEIISWYQPIDIRCQETGRLIGYKRRFKEHQLRRHYKHLGEKFALSTKRTIDAISRLAALSLIDVTPITHPTKKSADEAYFCPIVSKIRRITLLTQTMPAYQYQPSEPSQEALSLHAPKPQKRESSVGFDAFWNVYPESRRDSRVKMFELWDQKGYEELRETIVKDILQRKQEDQAWQEDALIPRTKTYLTQRRWEAAFTPVEKESKPPANTRQQIFNPLDPDFYHEQQVLQGHTSAQKNPITTDATHDEIVINTE